MIAATGVANASVSASRTLPPAARGTTTPGPVTSADSYAGSVPADARVEVALFLQDPEVEHGQPQNIQVPSSFLHVDGKRLEGPHFITENVRNPRILVADEDGGLVFPAATPEFDLVNAHVHAEGTVAMFEAMLGRPIRWDFGDPRRPRVSIHVNQHIEGGSFGQFNTKLLRLDVYRSLALGKEVRDSESVDGISHEVGHFILNSLRPKLDMDDPETGAFHEAFSDIAAMLYELGFDENIHRMSVETRGDWHRNNSIAEFGKEDGKATQLHDHPGSHRAHDLRSAVNDWAYVPPQELGEAANDNDISSEPHNFSKIFVGAFYDVLTGMAESREAQGVDRETAMKQARDRIKAIWGQAIGHLPEDKIKFADAARCMLDAAKSLGGTDADVIQKAFADRDIQTS